MNNIRINSVSPEQPRMMSQTGDITSAEQRLQLFLKIEQLSK